MILHAESAGEGAPLVLLHGLFGRARNLSYLARGLAAAHRVISIDLRNHGESPHAPGMSYGDQAGDVLETLDALGARSADMLGHSMGGKVAMACALHAPLRVRRLLVGDIAPVAYAHRNTAVAAAMAAVVLRPGMTRADAAAALAEDVPDVAVRRFLVQNFQPGEVPGWRIGLNFIAADMTDIEAWPDSALGRFEGPVLFVSGEASDYVQRAHHGVARTLFPAARFITLKKAGHWLHADQPEAFLGVAQAFFR